MLPYYGVLEELARQRMIEAEAKAARMRLLPARPPLRARAQRLLGVLRIDVQGDRACGGRADQPRPRIGGPGGAANTAQEQELVAGLTPTELGSLAALLQKLLSRLEDGSGGDPEPNGQI